MVAKENETHAATHTGVPCETLTRMSLLQKKGSAPKAGGVGEKS